MTNEQDLTGSRLLLDSSEFNSFVDVIERLGMIMINSYNFGDRASLLDMMIESQADFALLNIDGRGTVARIAALPDEVVKKVVYVRNEMTPSQMFLPLERLELAYLTIPTEHLAENLKSAFLRSLAK